MLFKNTFISLLLILFSGLAQAQSIEDSFSIQNITEIVVTGEFEPQEARRSVYQVRTIGQETIRARGATRLQDVLTTETNIRFSQDLALGGSNLSMQGLAGQNVKILIDGVPMVGRQGSSNEININHIDINSIQRIEIVEGPMSVIYGADALAGVINIITKKAVEGRADLSVRIHEETAGNEYGWPEGLHNQSLSGGYKKGDWNFKGDLSRNAFGGWQGTGIGRDVQWHPKTQYLVGGVVGLEKTRTTAHYRLDLMQEDVYNPGTVAAGQAIDQNYLTTRWMNQVQWNHNLTGRLKLNGSMAFTHFQRKTQTTLFNEATGDRRLSLAPDSQDTTFFRGFSTRILLPWKINSFFSMMPGLDINVESGKGGRIEPGTHSIGDYGLILSGEWRVSEKLQLRPGLRFTHNSTYQAPPLLPSLNIRWAFAKQHDLRLAYGRGFRAPSLRELYFSFFDSNHSIVGNAELTAELSQSFSASWNWTVWQKDAHQLTAGLTGFYNDVDNMIGYGQKPGNVLLVSYINIDRFKTKGLTANMNWKTPALQFTLTGSYTGRYNQAGLNEAILEEFTWSPEIAATLTYTLAPWGTSISLFHKYTGKTPYFEIISEGNEQKLRQAEVDAYSWTDLSLKKEFKKFGSIALGMRNLFNVININTATLNGTGVHSGGANRPVGYGRSFFATIHYTIIK